MTVTDASTSIPQQEQRQKQRRTRTQRVWEVDALRGLAVVMMVVYHFMYDLYFFRVTDAIFTNPFWFYFQRTTATLFIGLVGVSLALRCQRRGSVRFVDLSKRGATILLWGLVISGVTWLALGPTSYIRFGILHFIGLAIVVAYPFLRLRRLNLLLGIGLIGFGVWLQQFTFAPPWSYLFWLGLEPPNHTYVDFFPFIRWFGVVLIGIALGNLLYGRTDRRFHLPVHGGSGLVAGLTTLGRHSLSIYLIHQPVLLALFALFFLLFPWIT